MMMIVREKFKQNSTFFAGVSVTKKIILFMRVNRFVLFSIVEGEKNFEVNKFLLKLP